MHKITPQVRENLDIFSKALETYYEFFGKLPDLAKQKNRSELYSIYEDLKYTVENIKERQNREENK